MNKDEPQVSSVAVLVHLRPSQMNPGQTIDDMQCHSSKGAPEIANEATVCTEPRPGRRSRPGATPPPPLFEAVGWDLEAPAAPALLKRAKGAARPIWSLRIAFKISGFRM